MSFFEEDSVSSTYGDKSTVINREYEEAKRAWEATVSRLDNTQEVEEDAEATKGSVVVESSVDVTELSGVEVSEETEPSDSIDEINTEATEDENVESSEMFEAMFAQKVDGFTTDSLMIESNGEAITSEDDDSSEESNELDAGEESRRFADYFSGRDFGLSHNFDMPVSNLFIQDATGNITQLFESDLMNPGGRSVDISQFLNGDTLLAAYTIPQTQTMTLGDLLNYTTILNPEMFSMQELPIMTTNGSMTSMTDISSMMRGMMSMFMGSGSSTNLELPMSEDMMNSFMPMMESFMNGMGAMDEMPVDDFLNMMQGMMGMMMQDGMMDNMSAMTESMMAMMQESMNMVPMESFTAMMTTMMETFSTLLENSENPLEDMSQAMGAMMLTFMADINGVSNEEAISEFGLSMGNMVNQFMIMMGGESEDPSAAIGMMMGSMMGSMMNTMAEGTMLSMNSFSSMLSGMMNNFMGNMAGMSEMLMGMGDFETVIAQMQEASSALPTLEDILPSNLYVQMSDGSLVNLRETELMSADSLSVDISEFLNANDLLVGYTIPTADMMSVEDLMSMTTLIQPDMFTMPQMPMFTLESGDASMMDISSMLTQMVGMFVMGSDGMPMSDGTSDAFMNMMQNFMSMDSMSSMPVDEMMGMMSQMMSLMSLSSDMEMMMAMPESMMSMMQEAMSAMPLAEMSVMMGMMMDTFTQEFTSSDEPFANMANTMGAMMYSFMDGMTGSDSEAPAAEFALAMGEMVNQFMVGATGGNEDPAAAMGDMMGSMMGSMMIGMTGDPVAPLESFANSMSSMMGSFMTNMSEGMVAVMDPMTDMMNTMMSGMDGNMAIIASMFETANETAGLVIEESPQYLETILRLSDDIGVMADSIGEMADGIVDTQVIQSSNFLATQDRALELIELLASQEGMLTGMMGAADFNAMMASLEGSATMMSSLTSVSESFPSTLYIEDVNGALAQLPESQLLNDDGTYADISEMLNGDTLLVGYTIPNAETMNLASLLDLTTMVEGGAFSLEDLPMIPTDDGSMISINDFSSMMNSMMGMFMGAQMTSADGSMMDMGSMDAMMAPYMDMMSSFMGGMNMDSMMPMMSGMMETMMGMMNSSDMMDPMAGMSSAMMDMMSTSMSAMPIDSFGSMAGALMDTFTQEILLDGNPMDNMANTMGSMMYEFMNGMTGNDSEAPAQEFALTMGQMVNQFMVGATGGNEDPAAAMGDMMGSMMSGMMAGMTGDSEAPLESFTTTMSDMMGSFMIDAATSAATVLNPMDSMLNTFVNGIDGNMAFIESMFNTANDTALSLIQQSPEYMTTILRLSDDIGLMAERINEMGDRIVETQVIQSENFLATQDNMIAMIDSLMSQKEVLTTATDGVDALMSVADFDTMMSNFSSAQASIASLVSAPEVTMDDIFATQLYIQDENGALTKVSEADLTLPDGSTDISALLVGGSLLVGYTMPNSENMNLAELISMTTMIQSSGMDMSQMPMFPLSTGDSSVMDMSGMMESMMGMFMGSGMIPTDEMNPDMVAPFMEMMNSFMGGAVTDMPMDEFNTMMSGMMNTMMSSGMTDSMMDMSGSMMDMMGSSMSAMPMESFSYMMSAMMENFGEIFAEGDNPMDAMAHTMGSMMLEFMHGMTGNDSDAPAGEFARTMGEMINQFMVGVTGTSENSAAAMGDMMGSMMGSFMTSVTGDVENPMESFATTMSNMMSSMMGDMSTSAAIVMDPMADMMNTFLIGIDGNMEFIASMFERANGTMQSMIELSPEYMTTILRLSDDIGLMAGRIDEMADKIVNTIDLQSTNFEITQSNALDLIDMLSANAPAFIELLGESEFSTMMADLGKIETSLNGISERVTAETATIFPSDLFVQDMLTGELTKMSEEDMMAEDGSYVDITQLLDTNSMLVAYTVPMNDEMSLSDLMSMTTLVEGSDFSMGMLPMFGGNNSIIDINSFMNMALNPETLSMMSMPVEQFNATILAYQEQIAQSDSPFDAMGQTMGAMMISFMGGMTETDSEDTPLIFAQQMGKMSREFMIGVTDGNEEPAAAMGEMMGNMMGSFMSSMTFNDETPMTQFTNTISNMMSSFSTDMTNSMLTMLDPTTDLLNTVVNGINGNMEFIAAMFDSANGTVEEIIEQTPAYLDTMVRLSDDIGLMADRINDMGDKIVDTQVILSETFLITQANSLEVMNSINENAEYFISMIGETAFNDMMANFSLLDTAMGGAKENMVLPDNFEMSSALYAMDAEGVISQISEADLTDAMNNSVTIEEFLNGSQVLVGYTVPSVQNMTFSELLESTTVLDENVGVEALPMFNLDGMDASALDMSEMMNSVMSIMMGQNMGVPLDELVSKPFMSMMESFANGMGLEVDTFMMMMNQMMDTMMISDMMDSMTAMANQMVDSMNFSMGGTEVTSFNEMMGVMMNTFMADGSPMATMADMMGSMMTSLMGGIVPGENDTIDSMAYQMGSMIEAYFVGVTGTDAVDGSPSQAMGDMMGSMMNSFMNSVTGDGESFSEVMSTMMDRFMADMGESMMAISQPMMDSINTLLNGMDANMELLGSMMASANDTVGMAIDLTPEYIDAMTSLSNDIVEMAGRVDEMVDKIDTTSQLQLENMAVTQENVFALIDTLGDNPVFDAIVANLEAAKELIIPELSVAVTDVMFEQGVMSVTDASISELFTVSSFDSTGASAELYEYNLGFSGVDNLLVEFNSSISNLSFNLELANYISVDAFDSNRDKIELDGCNFSIDSSTSPSVVTITGVNDLKYISVDGGANSAFTLSLNSIENIALTDLVVNDIPQELTYSVFLDQVSQEDMTVPLSVNGLLSEVIIPAGETSVDFGMNIEDDLLSQGLDSLDVSLEAPREDALYTLSAESSNISSVISDLSIKGSAFDMPNESTLDSVELFALVEQDVGILDLTNSLSETVTIDTTELFSDTSDDSLNSMLTITGDSEDSIDINVHEWTEVETVDGFTEYASTKDITVTLQIEDDLSIV